MLFDISRPMVILPSLEGDISLTELALSIVSEMEVTLSEADWESITPKDLKKLSRVLLKNIQRLKRLEGSVQIFNEDVIKAGVLLEQKLKQLSHYLNSALLELKSRREVATYVSTLSDVLDLLEQQSCSNLKPRDTYEGGDQYEGYL